MTINLRTDYIRERFLDYELGHLDLVRNLFEKYERRDAAEILPESLPDPIPFESQREFVRKTLEAEIDLRTDGARFVSKEEEGQKSLDYRQHINSEGSPSTTVAEGYVWTPGTELNQKADTQ